VFHSYADLEVMFRTHIEDIYYFSLNLRRR